MLERGEMDRRIEEMVGTESLVPQDHLLWKIDASADFNRIYEIMVSPSHKTDTKCGEKAE